MQAVQALGYRNPGGQPGIDHVGHGRVPERSGELSEDDLGCADQLVVPEWLYLRNSETGIYDRIADGALDLLIESPPARVELAVPRPHLVWIFLSNGEGNGLRNAAGSEVDTAFGKALDIRIEELLIERTAAQVRAEPPGPRCCRGRHGTDPQGRVRALIWLRPHDEIVQVIVPAGIAERLAGEGEPENVKPFLHA